MTQHLKFGWHTGSGGIGVPKENYAQLDTAGIPFFAKGADSFPFDAQQVALSSLLPHTVVFRRSVAHNGSVPPSGNPDVPDYNKSPHDAAVEHYGWHYNHMPPEMDPSVTWLEIINEVDKNHSEWLAEFAVECAQMALDDGVRLAMFGWSTGEPEVAHWEGPKMLECLQFYAQFPDQLAIALHEYSLTSSTLWQDSPYLVGRFQFLHDVCDAHNIPRPTILITEFGWTYTSVAADQKVDELVEVGALYAEYPNVKGAGIWYLGAGYNNIAQMAQVMIQPLQDKLLTVTYPDPEPPPPVDDRTFYQRAWDASVKHQTKQGVQLNKDAALQKQMIVDGHIPLDALIPVENELPFEDAVVQAAESMGTDERYLYIWRNGQVERITDPYVTDPEPPPPPPPQTEYTGPAVNFVAMVDQSASDWRWPQAKAVFDVTGLTPKFHTQGNNHQWYNQYKSPIFNLVRILVDPNFSGDLFAETEQNVAQFYALGSRDFEVLNEPNVEGMGVRWNSGAEFGLVFREYCKDLKARFPGIRLWYPGLSPGFGAQYAFINDSISVGAFDHIYGVCEHCYSGITDNADAARNQMFTEIVDFRSRYAMTRPLVISEMSVNRPASAEYKARVYKDLFVQLSAVEGIQACVSFTSDWEPSGDENREGWLKWGIHNAYTNV